MTIIAQTPRLIIREFLPEEEDIFVELHKDEQVLKYIPRRSEEENRKLFKESLEAYRDGSGLSRWGMFDKATGDFVGACLLRPAKEAPGKVEMGYSMHVKYWGMGLATEMAKVMIDFGLNQMNFPVICAVTHPENIASQNVLLKAGMQQGADVFWHEATLPYFEIVK
jgi:ribosomal-protein-alanine N-acetyltransferase